MGKVRLGVNIDHVATIRNARGEIYPSPLAAALIAQDSGASSITIHLREDRRHIIDSDLKDIKNRLDIPLNLEIAPTKEMVKIALKHKPNYVCIVPEKRQELTTEGGLNLNNKKKSLKNIIRRLKKRGIRVSLFIEAKEKDVLLAKRLGADCIEIHTGVICNLINKNLDYRKNFMKIKKAVNLAKKIGTEVHAGHGLTYKSARILKKIKNVKEFNIGHFLISESLFLGLKKSILNFREILK